MVVGFFGANWLSLGMFTPAYSRERQVVLDAPYQESSYVPLAKSLWDAGEEAAAKRQLAMAHESSQPVVRASAKQEGATLGVQTSFEDSWHADDNNDRKLYAFWKERLKGHEQWRDAYLMLTVLAYRLGYKQEARFYIEKAQQIDPYSDAVARIRQQIGD